MRTAAAEVTVERGLDLRAGRIRISLQQRGGAHQDSGQAIAALQRLFGDKGALQRVRMVLTSTAGSPNEGVTSGSLSVQHSGRAIRFACAEIRKLFLDAAAERLGVAPDVLSISDGTIAGPGNGSTSYW